MKDINGTDHWFAEGEGDAERGSKGREKWHGKKKVVGGNWF